MGITAVRAVRIYHGSGLGQNVLALVVVSDYQINAQIPAQFCLTDSSNAAVHSDDEFDTLSVQLADGDGIQAIAFFQASGNVADHIRTLVPQKVGK